MNSHSTDRPDREQELCVWCKQPRESHNPWCPTPPAFLSENPEAVLIESSQGQAREILRVPLAEGGSFLIRRGGEDLRSWWLTASFVSGCLVLTLEPSESGSNDTTSASGTATGKTSDSSKSSTGEGRVIGLSREAAASHYVQTGHGEFASHTPGVWHCVECTGGMRV